MLMKMIRIINDRTNDGLYNCFPLALEGFRFKVLYRLRKWRTTMFVLVLQELGLIYIIDSESVIDFHQYMGKEDFTTDDEEKDYIRDDDGNIIGLDDDSDDDGDDDVDDDEEEEEEDADEDD